MKENPFNAPMEGDFNSDAIQDGLSEEDGKNLKKNLETAESAKDSFNDTNNELNPQKLYEDDRQRERGEYQVELDNFEEFIRAKGISEEEISCLDLDHFLQFGTAGKSFTSEAEQAQYLKKLEGLEKEWQEIQ